MSEVKGKDITELIASGREKFASVPSGGAAAPAAAAPAGGAVAAPAAAESKKEEKVEEKEESDDVSLFGCINFKQFISSSIHSVGILLMFRLWLISY